MKNKYFEIIATIGEVLILVGTALWITRWSWIQYVFVAGAVMFAVGRLLFKNPETTNFVLKRLYRQQAIGVIMVLIASGMMLFYHTPNTGWLVPFIIFVVFETYTAFRIPAVIKKEEKKHQ